MDDRDLRTICVLGLTFVVLGAVAIGAMVVETIIRRRL